MGMKETLFPACAVSIVAMPVHVLFGLPCDCPVIPQVSSHSSKVARIFE
jgi:hypothetical protein